MEGETGGVNDEVARDIIACCGVKYKSSQYYFFHLGLLVDHLLSFYSSQL